MRQALLSTILLPLTAIANPLDSIAIRMGLGIAKPSADLEFSNSSLETGFTRTIPTMPTAMVDFDLRIRSASWESGIRAGVDGEIISVDRTDGTGFSVAHIDGLASRKLFVLGNSSLWLNATAGLAYPVWRHDEAEHSDAECGPRLSAGLEFARQTFRFELGLSRTWLSFSDKNQQTTALSKWELSQAYLTMHWDWLAP